MSIDIPSHGNDPDESDPLKNLHIGQFDPRLEAIMDEFKKFQKTILDDDEEVIEANLEQLGDLLEEMGWVGDRVELTGKLRTTKWSTSEVFPIEFLNKYNLRISEDEHGEYVYVENIELLCGAPQTELEEIEEGAHDIAAYVFTFADSDELEAQFGNDERKKANYLANGGKLIMHPEDVEQLEFSNPSLEQIERFLEAHYPKVYEDILEVVGMDTGRNGDRMLRDLKKLTISQDLKMSPRTRAWIGGYVYSLVDVGQEAEYDFVISGPVEGIGAKPNSRVRATLNERLRGATIVAFDINEKTGRVDFVVADLSAYGAGYECVIVPIDSVARLISVRRMRNRFGEIAMNNFELPQDVAKYWHESKSSGSLGSHLVKDPEGEGLASDSSRGNEDLDTSKDKLPESYTESDIFEALEGQLSDIPLPEYNADGNFLEIALSRDLAHIVGVYHEWVLSHGGAGDGNEDMFTIILQKALEACDDLKAGDEIMTKNNVIVLVAGDVHGDKIEHSIEVVQGPDRIRGEFFAIVETDFPSPAMIESNGELFEKERGLGVVLRDPRIMSDTNEDKGHMWINRTIIVKIPNTIGYSTSDDETQVVFSKIEKPQEFDDRG